jgi:hypothetical protein
MTSLDTTKDSQAGESNVSSLTPPLVFAMLKACPAEWQPWLRLALPYISYRLIFYYIV